MDEVPQRIAPPAKAQRNRWTTDDGHINIDSLPACFLGFNHLDGMAEEDFQR
jgi:hypothetical protein